MHRKVVFLPPVFDGGMAEVNISASLFSGEEFFLLTSLTRS